MDFHQLVTQAVLLPVGVCLAMVGILLRGFVRSNRRSAALDQQHQLHHRKPGESDHLENKTGWLEQHLPSIANTATLAGAIITLVSFFR
jgi:hypothetical protein